MRQLEHNIKSSQLHMPYLHLPKEIMTAMTLKYKKINKNLNWWKILLRYFKSMNCSDYVLVVFAESPIFEGSMPERDTNHFCKVNAAM